MIVIQSYKVSLISFQARWIKFEEKRLEGAERWGKPHVASLSFHSVINLRSIIDEQCKNTVGEGDNYKKRRVVLGPVQ